MTSGNAFEHSGGACGSSAKARPLATAGISEVAVSAKSTGTSGVQSAAWTASTWWQKASSSSWQAAQPTRGTWSQNSTSWTAADYAAWNAARSTWAGTSWVGGGWNPTPYGVKDTQPAKAPGKAQEAPSVWQEQPAHSVSPAEPALSAAPSSPTKTASAIAAEVESFAVGSGKLEEEAKPLLEPMECRPDKDVSAHVCPACGNEYAPGALNCRKCSQETTGAGTRVSRADATPAVPLINVCDTCGNEYAPGALNCRKCINDTEATTTVTDLSYQDVLSSAQSSVTVRETVAEVLPEVDSCNQLLKGKEGFGGWLLEIDAEGELSVYKSVLEENYDTVDQIIRLYGSEDVILYESFFDDAGIDNADHRRLFLKWFSSCEHRDEEHSPEAHQEGPSSAVAPSRDQEEEESQAELPSFPEPLREASRVPVGARDDTPSGRCWAPLALLWGGRARRGRSSGPRLQSEPPPKAWQHSGVLHAGLADSAEPPPLTATARSETAEI